MKGIIALSLLSLLSKIFILEYTRQYKLPLDHDSNRVNYLLINKTIPVTLFDTLLIFHDINKKFELQGDILKMIIEKKDNADLANIWDKSKTLDFAKEMYFDERALGNENLRDESFTSLPKSLAIMSS